MGPRFNPLRHMAQKRSFWKTGREAGDPQPALPSDRAGHQEGSHPAPGHDHPADTSRPATPQGQVHPRPAERRGPGPRASWLGWIFDLFLLYSLTTPKRSSQGPPPSGQAQWAGPRQRWLLGVYTKQSTVLSCPRQTKAVSTPAGASPLLLPPSVPLRRGSKGLGLRARLGPGGHPGLGYRLRAPRSPRGAPAGSRACSATSPAASRCFSGTDLRIF